MLHTRTLADILDNRVNLCVGEAVAIIQQLINDDTVADDATGPYGPLALSNVEITVDGRVRCRATAARPSVFEAGALLQDLLFAVDGTIPGALRYTLGRALLEVEAPPFDSREQFVAALERFEVGPRAEIIATLHARASARGVRGVEHRRPSATHAALRRELRDADLRLYAAVAASRRIERPEPSRARMHGGPLAACLLAGAALIVAGGGNDSTALQTPRPATPAPATQQALVREGDIALTPSSDTASPASLVRTPTSTSTRVAARTARGRGTAPAQAVEGKRGKRGTSRAAASRVRARADADRGVIARIRFEWDNPFR